MVKPVSAPHVGDALNFDTMLEVGTLPLGASSSGFTIKLDPTTGLQVRTATTFGPSFAERALTSGEGGDQSRRQLHESRASTGSAVRRFEGMQVRSTSAPSATDSRSGTINLSETATTGSRRRPNGRHRQARHRRDAADRHRQSEWLDLARATARGDILTYAHGKRSGLGDSATSPAWPSTGFIRSAAVSRIPAGWP